MKYLLINGLLARIDHHDALLDHIRDMPINTDVMIVDKLVKVTAFGKRN